MPAEIITTGTCTKCGKACRYVSMSTRGFWVHDDTGDFMSAEPERHDCNTHIARTAPSQTW